MKTRKRPFQLLELMVAMFILLLCLAPIMNILTSMYQAQRAMIRENQRDHLAHTIHAHLVEQLYQYKIPIDHIKNDIIELNDPDITKLLTEHAFAYQGVFTILKTHQPRDQEKPSEYLCKHEIKMRDKNYKPSSLTMKKINNQEGDLTFYDYYVYINSKDLHQDDEEQQQTDRETEEDEFDDDEPDDASDPQANQPQQNSIKPVNQTRQKANPHVK